MLSKCERSSKLKTEDSLIMLIVLSGVPIEIPDTIEVNRNKNRSYAPLVLHDFLLKLSSATSNFLTWLLPANQTPRWKMIVHQQWFSNFNSLAPGKLGCHLTLNSNFQMHINDRYLENFKRNCPQANATKPQWWLVNIGSGNLSKSWPRSLSPHGVTRPQWVNRESKSS